VPSYHRLGDVPAKRHVQFRSPEGSLLAEEVFGAEGFSGNYSILYHRALPAQARTTTRIGAAKPTVWESAEHRHYHLRTRRLEPRGDPVGGRVPLMYNGDVTISLALPAEPQTNFYKNGTRDELIFVHEGSGVLETQFGEISFGPGDYLYVPRGTIQHLQLAGNQGRLLVVEANGPIDTPSRYRNEHGQLLEHAPYWERDFRKPERLTPRDEQGAGAFEILLKIGDERHRYTVDHHPFDVVGWDGYLYPYAFNIGDFEPRAGRYHLPPPTHQTFAGPGFVVCSFCPRLLDWDANAMPIPYFHSNIDSDEMMYYVGGDYGARKVENGSITLHPRGWPHGPSAGAREASLGKPRETNELAVMVDTFRPLRLAAAAAELDDPAYLRSWDLL